MTSQHDRDSRELRELCAQRDAARATVRQQAERIAELEGERDKWKSAEHALSESYVRVREAIGAMRPPSLETAELWVYVEQTAQSLTAERDQLRAEVERLRADAERYVWLRDNHESEWAICEWQDDPDGLGYYRDARAPEFVDAAIDHARTTHKDEG